MINKNKKLMANRLKAKLFTIFFATLVVFACSGSLTANAQFAVNSNQSLPLDGVSYNDMIKPPNDKASAIDKVKDTLGIGKENSGVLYIVKVILQSLAILMIIISAVRILTAGGEEEVIKKQTKQLLASILGLVLVSVSTDVLDIFMIEKGGVLKSENSIRESLQAFNYKTNIVISFFRYIIGGIAVFGLILSGLHLITMEDPAKADEDKKRFGFSAAGLIVILLSNTLVTKVFYVLDINKLHSTYATVKPGLDPNAGLLQLASITNYVVQFVGPLAVLALIVGAVMYMVAGGEASKQDRARRVVTAAIIGIVLIYGAFALVATVVARKFGA